MTDSCGYMYKPSELCESYLKERLGNEKSWSTDNNIILSSDIERSEALKKLSQIAVSGNLEKAAKLVAANDKIFDKPEIRIKVKKEFDLVIDTHEKRLDDGFLSSGIFAAQEGYYDEKNRLTKLRLGLIKTNFFDKEPLRDIFPPYSKARR
ncbi:MAG: hypothetical protein Q8P80_02445 [Candidatus Levybacteria bacterium]|nr:hypothetical protein [Candidatus Levybacteria bacterium]